MLEEKIERLVAETIKLREAVERNTAAQGGTAGSAAGKPAAAAGKPAAAAGKPKKSKFDANAIKAAVIKVKDEVSQEAAQEIIRNAGATGLAELITMTDKFDDVMAACEAAIEGGGEDAVEDDDGLSGL